MHGESFAERVEFLIDRLGGPGKVVKNTGISYTTLSRWKEGGDSDVKIGSINSLASLANVSLDWLINGIGSPFIGESGKQTSNTMEDYYLIPAYDIEVSAGHGAFTDGAVAPNRHFAFRKRWVQARGLDPKQLSAVFARGDSMEPTIKDGAVVVIDHRKGRAMDGKIYAIRMDERLWVKRTQWIGGGGLRLISDNTFYQPIDITKEELALENNIKVIGQVIHTSHDFPD